MAETASGIPDGAWADVLSAVDRTYAELVEYQGQLETRNSELETLRRFLASVLTSVSDYLIVTEKDGHITEASRSFRDDTGLDAAHLAMRNISEFLDASDRETMASAMAQACGTRAARTIKVGLLAAKGVEPVEFRVAPRLDRRGKATGVVLTGRPLGELTRAYAELEDSHKNLQEAQGQLVRNEKMASLGRLLAGVAHELNNPISFVYANTHALEKYLDRFETYFEEVQAGATRERLVELRAQLRLDRDLKNLRTAIEGARDGAERVRAIVEDLRRLSADGSGAMAPFDLAECARLSANWVERGSKSGAKVTFSGEGRCMALGRPGHIQQVIMNLVQNASDAMGDCEAPQIDLCLSQDAEFAILDVRDNGPGVPLDAREKIFDPFFTTKEVGRGTGLGLSISHKIAEEHGGWLGLLPDDGKGATFRLKLPRGDRP